MQKTNLNVSPIFDDFDETKSFHRVLFNAGKSVQARELTQLQSILQSQIERMGKHLFTEGSMVVPGGINAIEAQDCIKLSLNNGSLYSDFSSETELYVKNVATGMTYKVAKTFDANVIDPVTLFIDLLTPGTGQEKKFLANDQIALFVYNSNGTQRNVALGMVTSTAQGSWVKVQNGVYFVRGMFVRTDDQDFVVSKYTTDTTIKVGFKVIEEIITSDEDPSLLSNANGFANLNAPGASRLKVTLSLTGLDIGFVDKDFIEIARFDGGSLSSKLDQTQYSIIEQAIAQRTYETNGDYVVNPFGLDIKEHLNDGTNNGVYNVAAGGDATKLVAAVRPGVAYVKGFRVENIGIQNAPFDKARDTAFLNNASYTADYGQYFLVNNVKSLPDIDIKKKILLLDAGVTQIGTARVRAMRKESSTSFRVFVFDIVLDAGKIISDVKSIKYSDASNLFTADLAFPSLFDSNKNSLVFKLPVSAVKSLFVSGVGGDTSYTVLRSFTLTTNGAGVVSASVGANEFFNAVDNLSWFIALTGSASAGTQYDPTTSVTLGGTIQGTTMTIDLGAPGANQTIKVIAPVLKAQTTQKTKTLLTVTDEVIGFVNTNRQRFTKADIYDIVSVKDNSTDEDITSMFSFDSGQKDSWYESGRLITADANVLLRTVKVTYRYFAHSAGDYFTVDSYSGISRENMPLYQGNNLADYIDFRPLKDANDDFTAVTVSGEILKPGDAVRADITYYLPRNDILVVDENGVFSTVRGISSLTPVTPIEPPTTLKLFELYIPAYTMKPSDVTIKTVDNKRYTMRDIGKLEARIANVEYYTTLSALETNTNKTEVIDPVTGNNRFKNGFAVDGFSDYRMSDMQNPEWSASMDLDARLLKPSFGQNESGFTTSSLVSAVKPDTVYMMGFTEVKAIDQPYATSTININPYAVYAWVGNILLTPNRDFWKDVQYTQPLVINNTVNLTEGAVEGSVWSSWIKTTYDELGGHKAWAQQQYKSLNYTTTFQQQTFSSATDDLVATRVIPFIRPQTIQFSGTGFRPFTRLYPFWDGVDVSAFCRPTTGNDGDALITDASGALVGDFDIPIGRFKVGESVLRLTDSATDSLDPNVLTSFGSTTFTSGGVLDTRQVTTTNTLVITANTTITGVRYQDPIAQTFTPPKACFVTKFNVFFSSKARDIPVTLELRTAFSGFPTSDVIGRVTLNPSAVSISADGTVPTSFVFDDPVYLQDGLEYAIVLVANTQEYNVFIAQQGQDIIGSQMALSKQAYMGVFLTSSNSSTWNALQNTDLKFEMHRAVFNTAGSAQIVFDANAPVAKPLAANALVSTTGSNIVKANLKSHGLRVGDSVTIAGAVDGNGLVDAGLNGSKIVVAADIDSFSYTATTNATSSGSMGGAALTAIVNYPFNILVNNVDSFTPADTSVTWEYQYKTQANRVMSGWLPLAPKENTKADTEGVLKASGDVQIRATLTTTDDSVSPMIESSGFNAVFISPRVDTVSKVFNYVSTDIKFDNPTTTAKFYVGARLPDVSGMKVYAKILNSADQDVPSTAWTEITPVNPIANSENYVEYEYDLSGNFIGYKIKVELTGNRNNPPDLSDIRTLAFA